MEDTMEKPKKRVPRTDKVNWQEEMRASHCIRNIRQVLDTYWDDDYKLFKIKQSIKRYIDNA